MKGQGKTVSALLMLLAFQVATLHFYRLHVFSTVHIPSQLSLGCWTNEHDIIGEGMKARGGTRGSLGISRVLLSRLQHPSLQKYSSSLLRTLRGKKLLILKQISRYFFKFHSFSSFFVGFFIVVVFMHIS